MVFERIKELVISDMNIAPERITLEAKIMEDLGADSIDSIELIMKLEEEFNITISDEEATTIKTIGDAVKLITQKTQG